MLFNLDTHYGLRDDTREIVASYRSNDDCLMSQSLSRYKPIANYTFKILGLENCMKKIVKTEIKVNIY